MAKKKNGKAGFGEKNPNAAEQPDAQRGWSQGAWVAIGTIAAALITGTVAVLTQVLPKVSESTTPPTASSTPSPSAASSIPTPVPSSRPLTTTADAIAGKWSGTAKDASGTSFQITLEVRKSCSFRERCGSISVSHVPCEGEIFLEKAGDAAFEFHVANFYGRSNRDVCQPGAGEYFRLQSDGKLAYTTSYDAETQGILERVGD
jgi:hypothetical protein